MAIGQEMAPYIHTSFLNFKREEFGITNKKIENSEKLTHKIAELEKIKNQLEREAKSFLQGKTVKELFNEVYKEDLKFINISREIITNKQFYNRLNKRLNIIDTSNQNLSAELRKILINNIDRDLNPAELAEMLVNKYKSTHRTIKQKDVLIFLNQYFEGLNDKELLELANRKLTSLNKTGQLYKGIKKALQKHYTRSVSNLGEIAFLIFEEEFNKTFRQKGLVETIYNGKSDKDIYLEQVKSNFIKLLSNKSGTDISNLLGYGGEEIFTSIHQVGDKELMIEVIGSKTELEIHQGDIPKYIYNLRKDNAQSYSDLLLTYKGKKVRVQSKNYQSVLEVFNRKNTDVLQQMHLLQDESLMNFFDRIKRVPNQLGLDLKEIAYVLANEAWFSTAGNIRIENKSTYGPVEKMDLFQSYIDAILSNALINYLGIMLEDTAGKEEVEVSIGNSNIFFLIDNKFLVPTYAIVENLITNLREWKSGVEGVYLRIDKNLPYNAQDAISLLEEKENRLGSRGFISEGGYADTSLVSAGTDKGKEILEQLRIKSINLNISLKTLTTSSFQFF